MGQVLAPSLDIQGSHWLPSLTSPVGPMFQPLTLLSPKQLCVPQCALWSYGALCPPHLLLGPWGERTPLHRSGPGRGIASREAPPSTLCPTVPGAEATTTLEVFYTYYTHLKCVYFLYTLEVFYTYRAGMHLVPPWLTKAQHRISKDRCQLEELGAQQWPF